MAGEMPTHSSQHKHTKPKTVLLVEDNELDAELFELHHRRSGTQLPIVRAEHGEAALDFLSNAFSNGNNDALVIVFLDLNMPRMNGFELLESIKNAPWRSKLSVHILTTSGHASDRTLAEQYQVQSYQIKPITAELLQHIIGS